LASRGVGQGVGQDSRRRVDWDTEADRRSASELLTGAQSSALGEAVAWLTSWRAAHPSEVPAAELLADGTLQACGETLERLQRQLDQLNERSAEVEQARRVLQPRLASLAKVS
jgi:hypothetical protein